MSRRRTNTGTGIRVPHGERPPRAHGVGGCSGCLLWVVAPLTLLAVIMVACAGSGRQAAVEPTAATRARTVSTPEAPPTYTRRPAPSATAAPVATPTQDLSLPVAERYTTVPWWQSGIGGLTGLHTEEWAQPTGLVVAPDGTLYLATAAQSRIFHSDALGNVLGSWGGPSGTADDGSAPNGTFNEPWGLALSADGRLYVADTWNHRVQVFSTPDGTYITSWGQGGQGTEPYGLFGPRGIAVDTLGRVLVTDTGNNRVVLYTADGTYISQIGGQGSDPGQFREPVGIAVDSDGRLYVADSWNARVQELALDAAGTLTPVTSWPVDGWGSQDLLHKPYLCVAGERLYATDPAHDRVLAYTKEGTLVGTFDFAATGAFGLGMPVGIAADPSGGLWVSDIGMHMWAHIVPAD